MRNSFKDGESSAVMVTTVMKIIVVIAPIIADDSILGPFSIYVLSLTALDMTIPIAATVRPNRKITNDNIWTNFKNFGL